MENTQAWSSTGKPLTVAWLSFFPVEWLPGLPPELAHLPRGHPAPWQRVLLSELQSRTGLKVHILIVRKTFPRSLSFEREGVTFHCIKAPGGLRAPSLFWLDTILIRKCLRTIQPDLLHAWGTENGAALVASRCGYPYLVTMQGLMNWMAEFLPLNRYQKLMAYLERLSLQRASHVTAESKFAAHLLATDYPHLKVCQIEHAPFPFFSQITRHPKTKPMRLLCVSMISYAKGVDTLIEAAEQLCAELDFELVLVGSRDEMFWKQIQSKLSPQLTARIVQRENLTSEQVAQELAAATMLVYPTRADNSPNAVKEAVGAGVPVIASRVGGIVDYVIPGKNGLLFEVGHVDECMEQIRAASQHPMFSKGTVDTQTLSNMREYLSAPAMGDSFFRAYKSVLQ